MNFDGTIYQMAYDSELGRMNFKITDKLKNYIEKITV